MRRVPTYRGAQQRGQLSRFSSFGAESPPPQLIQSFVSSDTCDLTKYIHGGTLMQQGVDLSGRWHAYCDCMFLGWELQTTYYFNNVEFVRPNGFSDTAWLSMVNVRAGGSIANAKAAGFSMRVEKRPVYSENWNSCIRQFCASPDGCGTPDGRRDPFNMNPGMLADPWTQVGSSARNIPMVGEGGDWRWIRDLAAMTVIDLRDYDVLALWKTKFSNAAKFILLSLKASLVPFLSIYMPVMAMMPVLLVASIEAIENRPWLWPNGPVPIPGVPGGGFGPSMALAKEQLLLKPLLEGHKDAAILAIKYFGKCGFGINIPCGAGEILQQICIDQIKDRDVNGVSEFERISDPTLQAVVMFLSKHGSELVQKAVNAIQGLKDGTVLAWLEMVFRELLDEPLLKPLMKEDTKLALRLLAIATGTANVVWMGYQNHTPAGTIVDDVVYKLLGFRPSLVQAYASAGTYAGLVAAKNEVAKGVSATGITLVMCASHITNIQVVLLRLISEFRKANNIIGGGLESLISNMQDTVDGMQAATETAKTVAVSTHALVSDNGTGTVGASPISVADQPRTAVVPLSVADQARAAIMGGQRVTAIRPTVGVAKTVVPYVPPPPSSSGAGAGGGTALLGLAVGGFMVAGPVGALVGAAAGAIMGAKSSPALAGYAEYSAHYGNFGDYGLSGNITDLRTGQSVVSQIRTIATSGSSTPTDPAGRVLQKGGGDVAARFVSQVADALPSVEDTLSTLRKSPGISGGTILAIGVAAALLLRGKKK